MTRLSSLVVAVVAGTSPVAMVVVGDPQALLVRRAISPVAMPPVVEAGRLRAVRLAPEA
jgi:hypothetical protein